MKKGFSNHSIKLSKQEFEIISDLVESIEFFCEYKKNDDLSFVLTFTNLDKASGLDELIKDALVYRGFDFNYNANLYGRRCENLIDKFHEILK